MTIAAAAVLDRLEAYYDAAPRAQSRVEEIGPFTLFVAESGWPYYARPRLAPRRKAVSTGSTIGGGARPLGARAGPPSRATVDDVRAVLARQRELDVPLAVEWVDETTPGLVDVVRSAGAHVEVCPLLVLDGNPRGDAGTARMLNADEADLISSTQAAVSVSFHHGGTAKGEAGLDARDEQLRVSAAETSGGGSVISDRLASGDLRMAAAFAPESPDAWPVGGGSSIRVDDVAEIVGVGVLPAYRRLGLAGQLTCLLATDAHERGVTTVFCSAQSADVARVYEAVGFRRVGTACIASVPDS